MQEKKQTDIQEVNHKNELTKFENYFDKVYRLLLNTIKELPEVRSQITPEREYLLGAACTYLAIVLLFDLDVLPSSMVGSRFTLQSQLTKEVDEILELIPYSDVSLAISGGIYFGIMVDGARRIAKERVPYIHAWIKVFILSELENRMKKLANKGQKR